MYLLAEGAGNDADVQSANVTSGTTQFGGRPKTVDRCSGNVSSTRHATLHHGGTPLKKKALETAKY